ncbi:hypothetical protein BDF19DRAFT_422551 [Syncephalis fuscata]|nr:hypothetical protein BDF19DRAFT_422551 [Syncephalis fuscata]
MATTRILHAILRRHGGSLTRYRPSTGYSVVDTLSRGYVVIPKTQKALFSRLSAPVYKEQSMGGIFANLPARDEQEHTLESDNRLEADDILPSDAILQALCKKEKSELTSKVAYRATTLLLDAQYNGIALDAADSDWETLKSSVLAAANNDVLALKTLASALLKFSKNGTTCAVMLYRLLGESGDSTSMCNYAVLLYQAPNGIKRDSIKAEAIFTKLADEGHGVAQLNLATMLIREKNDIKTAISLWERAGPLGHPAAYTELGKVYLLPRGVEQDFNKAYGYFKKAAELQDAEAQYLLGVPNALYNAGYCYFVGDGVARDERRAVEYWTMAAERNVPPALINLGKLYAEGRGGLNKDMNRAKSLWTRLVTRDDIFGESAKELLNNSQ